MPFSRPSLSDLRNQAAQDVASALPGTDPLLRFSNLGILSQVVAAMAHLHYGYLDWIAEQSTPMTATDVFLEAWGALKAVYRLPATQAQGSVVFGGTNGTVVPAGTQVVRGDGLIYTTQASATVALGVVTLSVLAQADPAGLLGARGNGLANMKFSLGTTIAGINSASTSSTEFTGGADLETDDALRSRVLLAYQNPSRGGAQSDYLRWALEVPGVTRAWCVPHGLGPGTVVVFFMMDVAQAVHGGFPQGISGCATLETRDVTATGDQLAVANHIFGLQPVTALVYANAPAANTVNFTISGLSGASPATKAAVAAAITQVFVDRAEIVSGSSTLALSFIQAAIAAVPLTEGFVITSPAGNIVSGSGQLPVLGSITWT